MSNSPTGRISTTGSSTSSVSDGGSGGSPARASRATTGSSTSSPCEVIACGALAAHIREIAARRGWPVVVRPLPARLHNRPEKITEYSERLRASAQSADSPVVMAYADCGTYGALDEFAGSHGMKRLPGLHCYDVFAGPDRIAKLFEEEPGTYLLTDYLIRTFDRTVLATLGLDRYPDLWPDYFGHYRRLVWLAQDPTPDLEAQADRIADRFGLPLTRVDTGLDRLESALAALLPASGTGAVDHHPTLSGAVDHSPRLGA